MDLREYESAERRAEMGDAEGIAQVMKVAVGSCKCMKRRFVRRRAIEAMERLGIRIVRTEAWQK